MGIQWRCSAAVAAGFFIGALGNGVVIQVLEEAVGQADDLCAGVFAA